MSASTFQQALNVSRETIERLEVYESLLLKWTQRINLVSKASVQHLWARHFLDSAQLAKYAPDSGTWLDLGSGGGFPALVVASIVNETHPNLAFQLVESDQRKCAFLRTVIRELSLNASVHASRIEDLPEIKAQVVTARALSDLKGLLTYSERHLNPDSVALFPKGATHLIEVQEALEEWRFDLQTSPSITDSDAVILEIRNIARAS